MSIKKSVARGAAAPQFVFAAALLASVRERYARLREEDGADAGLTSLEYALMAAAILVVVLLLAAAVVAVLNGRIAIINGL